MRRLAGPLAALAGTGVLVAAARAAAERRGRAWPLALAGGALLGVWYRQRSSADATAGDDVEDADGAGGPRSAVSAEARANRERGDILGGSETNPRGVSGGPDVGEGAVASGAADEGATESPDAGAGEKHGADEGDEAVRFTTDRREGAEPGPDLDEGTTDPRRGERIADEPVEIDLSAASLADEASEATGPDRSQAYPAREGTDPEPTAEDAPERDAEGAGTNPAPTPDESGTDDEEES